MASAPQTPLVITARVGMTPHGPCIPMQPRRPESGGNSPFPAADPPGLPRLSRPARPPPREPGLLVGSPRGYPRHTVISSSRSLPRCPKRTLTTPRQDKRPGETSPQLAATPSPWEGKFRMFCFFIIDYLRLTGLSLANWYFGSSSAGLSDPGLGSARSGHGAAAAVDTPPTRSRTRAAAQSQVALVHSPPKLHRPPAPRDFPEQEGKFSLPGVVVSYILQIQCFNVLMFNFSFCPPQIRLALTGRPHLVVEVSLQTGLRANTAQTPALKADTRNLTAPTRHPPAPARDPAAPRLDPQETRLPRQPRARCSPPLLLEP